MRSRLQDETEIRAPTRAVVVCAWVMGQVCVVSNTPAIASGLCNISFRNLRKKEMLQCTVVSVVQHYPTDMHALFFCISHFFVFFFSFSKAESGKKKSKKSSCKHTDFSSVKIRCLGLGGQVVRNGPFEGDHRFHFSLFSIMLIFRCFLHRRCSMEMWCPDDKGRESWVWVGPLTCGRA